MRLTGHQYRQLTDALLDAFPTENGLRGLSLYALGRNLDEFSTGPDLRTIVLTLIGSLAAQNKLSDLINAARDLNKDNNLLLAVANDFLPLFTPPNVQNFNHYNACFLGGNNVLVNRKVLRDALRDLADPMGFRILLVDGPRLSGKTYSTQFISYLVRAFKDSNHSFEPVWIDLKPFIGTEVEPIYLARRIVAQMRLDESTVPPVNEEQDARWVQYFCDRLIGQLSQRAETWWIVLDGFFSLKLPTATHDLIHELALRTARHLSNLRMVLISYQQGLPPEVEGSVQREAIGPIGAEDLAKFFIRFYEERNKPFADTDVAQAVEDVLQGVDPNDPQRVRKLGELVAKVSKGIVNKDKENEP